MHNTRFIPTEYTASRLLSSVGYFNFCVPPNVHVVWLLQEL